MLAGWGEEGRGRRRGEEGVGVRLGRRRAGGPAEEEGRGHLQQEEKSLLLSLSLFLSVSS